MKNINRILDLAGQKPLKEEIDDYLESEPLDDESLDLIEDYLTKNNSVAKLKEELDGFIEFAHENYNIQFSLRAVRCHGILFASDYGDIKIEKKYNQLTLQGTKERVYGKETKDVRACHLKK